MGSLRSNLGTGQRLHNRQIIVECGIAALRQSPAYPLSCQYASRAGFMHGFGA